MRVMMVQFGPGAENVANVLQPNPPISTIKTSIWLSNFRVTWFI